MALGIGRLSPGERGFQPVTPLANGTKWHQQLAYRLSPLVEHSCSTWTFFPEYVVERATRIEIRVLSLGRAVRRTLVNYSGVLRQVRRLSIRPRITMNGSVRGIFAG